MIIFPFKIYKVKKINTNMVFCVKCGAIKDEVNIYCGVCGNKHLIETEKNSKNKVDHKSINGSRNILSHPFVGEAFIIGLLLLLFFVFIDDIICFMFHGYICG